MGTKFKFFETKFILLFYADFIYFTILNLDIIYTKIILDYSKIIVNPQFKGLFLYCFSVYLSMQYDTIFYSKKIMLSNYLQ